MRAAHATDQRGGNNYRYARAQKEKQEEEEYWARQRKSDDFYKRLGGQVVRQRTATPRS